MRPEVDNENSVFTSKRYSRRLDFTMNLADKVYFTHSEGVEIPCSVNSSSPPSKVTTRWVTANHEDVESIGNLVHVRSDGTLFLGAFRQEQFDPKIHRNIYICIASDDHGSVASKEVHVHGGEYQFAFGIGYAWKIRGNLMM